MIQIYYGDGKGKTTAAIGAAIRAIGAGKSVAMVRFLKNNKSSELSEMSFIDVYKSPRKVPFANEMTVSDRLKYAKWVRDAMYFSKKNDDDVLILDEFLDLIDAGFISEEDAINLISSKEEMQEIIITGHKKYKKLFMMADYISEVKKEKHPFDKGLKARKGFEY